MTKPRHVETRDRYSVFQSVTTRWNDNDQFGHVNNTVYNTWMDTAVTAYFRIYCELSLGQETSTVAAETKFTFRRSISHPAEVESGFRVEHIGHSSIRSGVGIFLIGESEAVACGHMVHVWINPTTGRSVPIPDDVREGLSRAIFAEDGS